jgi:hypothetical protein
VRFWDLNGSPWQQVANAVWDVLAVVWWMIVAGLVACGACWFVGQFIYGEWIRENRPPRLRFLAERRLRRDLVRGVAEIEDYLRERDPAHINDKPARPGRPWAGRHRGWRRS